MTPTDFRAALKPMEREMTPKSLVLAKKADACLEHQKDRFGHYYRIHVDGAPLTDWCFSARAAWESAWRRLAFAR